MMFNTNLIQLNKYLNRSHVQSQSHLSVLQKSTLKCTSQNLKAQSIDTERPDKIKFSCCSSGKVILIAKYPSIHWCIPVMPKIDIQSKMKLSCFAAGYEIERFNTLA